LADTGFMARNWDDLDFDRLAEACLDAMSETEARQTIRAYEVALTVASTDESLLRDLLAATAALVAVAEGVTPRTVADDLFRRAVSDETWRHDYLPIFS
jgi:hypothetical protein